MKRLRTHRPVRTTLPVLLLWPLASASGAQTGADEIRAKLDDHTYVAQIKEERKSFIDSLLVVIADKKARPQQRCRAVVIVGEIRATEAVPLLIRHIHEIGRMFNTTLRFEVEFPCVGALRRIGKPSTGPILEQLKKRNSEGRRILLTYSLFKVEGGDVGEFLLEKALADAKAGKEKKHLTESMKLLRRFKAAYSQEASGDNLLMRRADSAADSGEADSADSADPMPQLPVTMPGGGR